MNEDIITLRKKSGRQRSHEHFPQGKTGYIPTGVGVNPYSKQGRKLYY